MSILRFAIPTVFATILIAPLSAQASQHYPHTINQRQANQQRRIFNGVKDGQISRQEYRNLERRSLSIQYQEKRDRLDGGRFTPKERYQLDQRLNNVSGSIYGDRHD
jgi:uncharacterized membrane protein